jgi:hypothetical protein
VEFMRFKVHNIHSVKRVSKTYRCIFTLPARLDDEKVMEYLPAGLAFVKSDTLEDVEIFWNPNKTRLLILNKERDKGCVVEKEKPKFVKYHKRSWYPVNHDKQVIYNAPYASVEKFFMNGVHNYDVDVDIIMGEEIVTDNKYKFYSVQK